MKEEGSSAPEVEGSVKEEGREGVPSRATPHTHTQHTHTHTHTLTAQMSMRVHLQSLSSYDNKHTIIYNTKRRE